MIVPDDRKRRLSASKSIIDLQQGDYVRRALGSRKVGFVEDIHSDGWVWVSWPSGLRELLPLCAIRKVRPGGHEFDARREP